MFRPLRRMPMTKAPIAVPEIVPTPPTSEVPPMTALAMASSSYITPSLGWGGDQAGHQHAARQPGQRAGDRIGEGVHARDVDSGQARGLGVRADRVDVPPEHGAVQHEGGREGDRHHQDDRIGNAREDDGRVAVRRSVVTMRSSAPVCRVPRRIRRGPRPPARR